MNRYYLHDGHVQIGPFTIEELKDKNLKPDTMVWYEGLKDWTKASNVDALKELFQAIPPPFAIPADLPIKKKNNRLIYTSIAIVVFILIIGFLAYQNFKSEKEIINVQSELNEKNKESEEQERKNDLLKAKDAELTIKNRIFRNQWRRYIILSGSNYFTSGFGGINGLQLTITNNLEYLIDNIEAEVDYIKADGGIYKTEKISFGEIPAHTYKKLPAPQSNRGTSVRIRIKLIRSASFNFCYDRSYEIQNGSIGISAPPTGVSGDASDPWKCD